MPRIPEYNRHETITDAPANIPVPLDFNTEVTDTVTRLAEDYGDIIAKQQEAIRNRDNAVKLLNIQTAIDDDFRAFDSGEERLTGQDTYDNLTRAKAFSTHTLEKYSKDVSDSDLILDIQRYVKGRYNHSATTLSAHQVKQRDELTKQALNSASESRAKDAYAGTPFEAVREKLFQQSVILVDNGVLNNTSAEDYIVKEEKKAAEAYIDGLIYRNPAEAVKVLKSGKFNNILDAGKPDKFIEEAIKRIEADEKDKKAAIDQAKADEKDRIKVLREETGSNFVEKLVNGKLTIKEILASPLEPTGENSKEYWRKQLDSTRESVKSGGGKATTPGIYGTLLTRILSDPESVSESEIVSYYGKGLTKTDTDKLLTRRRQHLTAEPDKKEATKAIINVMKSDKKAGMFGEGIEGDLELSRQLTALDTYIKNNPDKDPADYYEKITAPARDGFVTKALDKLMNPFGYEFAYGGGKPSAETMKNRREELSGKSNGLKVGDVQKGYRYKGGNPANKASWEKVQ